MATTLSREVIKGYFAMSLRVTAHFKVEFYVTFFGILFEPYSRRVWVFQRVGLNTKSRGGKSSRIASDASRVPAIPQDWGPSRDYQCHLPHGEGRCHIIVRNIILKKTNVQQLFRCFCTEWLTLPRPQMLRRGSEYTTTHLNSWSYKSSRAVVHNHAE